MVEPHFSLPLTSLHKHEPTMRKLLLCLALSTIHCSLFSQTPSNEIYQNLKKLNVLGSVLYIAAHPDDENNALLPYLAKEKMYRTAYLSLTRGDGGQNLIGPEQGVELGLIRTQELLAARKIDGSEQYFTRAYEFGFSKSAEEALKIWDHQKVLADAVWVIRQYQPDIIIARFPPDKRAGHGHHAASAIIAQEAFVAAADPNQFAEQFKYGAKPWQAKRIFWNTFNFGNNNTTSDNQLKIDIGVYNSLLGKSYGEIGGEARTMHKSQGEGRPRRKGSIMEYFTITNGDTAKNDLMERIDISWKRITGGDAIEQKIQAIIDSYSFEKPELTVPALMQVYKDIKALPETVWKNKKLNETQQLIEACAGLFAEVTTTQEFLVQGDTLKTGFFLNKRKNINVILKGIKLENFDSTFSLNLGTNANIGFNKNLVIAASKKISQPYWLEYPQTEGMFDVKDQTLIGKAENEPSFEASMLVDIEGESFVLKRPVQFKTIDPVRGEVYQPVAVLPVHEENFDKENYLVVNKKTAVDKIETQQKNGVNTQTIKYDHIPTLTYFKPAKANIISLNLKTKGKRIGYIAGAGDKLPEALENMGYDLKFLGEKDITETNLKKFDAIITGIRAYNMYAWLSNKNDVLNNYVSNGGNLIVQYLKSNTVGQNKVKVGPYPFVVNAGIRVTEEKATVKFVLPKHPVLNYPNKITDIDFTKWVQERSTYQAEQLDTLHFATPLAMNDTGEKESNGSLAIAKYGKGNFAYVSLVLFRQLPAGVPGAYRLLANLIALPKNK
jgi:LmbE family N-acetylglucosaminyl deacetylase